MPRFSLLAPVQNLEILSAYLGETLIVSTEQAGEVKEEEEEDVKPERQQDPGAASEREEAQQASRYTSHQDNQAPYGRKRHHDDAHGYSYYEHREDKR